MDKYTVLLVDDEEEVIQVIMRKINWEGLGFSVIGYANNGVKALEMVEEFQPDVVMTDIKMPYMDGMELSRHIKTEFPATKILLFTGFDEFEYAKEAVHMEVEEYILKPVNSVDITNVFTQMKIKLDQEISEKRNVETLKKYYLDSLPILQTNFYSTLIEGRIQKKDLARYLSDYQISFTGPYYCCVVIHASSADEAPEDIKPLLMFTAVQKQSQERLGKKWMAKSFTYLGRTILIVQLKNKSEISELTDECDRFCKYVRRMIGVDITVGIGKVCEDILDLSQSYASAKEAVSYRAIYGAVRAINIQEIAPKKEDGVEAAGDTELANLFKIIRLSTTEKIEKAVDQYLNSISVPAKSLQQHHIDMMELVSSLYKFAMNNGISMEELGGDMRKLYVGLLDFEPELLRNWLINMSRYFSENIVSERSRSRKSFVLRAKEYVYNNYGDEQLSLDYVCEVLGMSNSYFSTIFKKETGQNFTTYLTDYRLNEASRLLMETNEKSYIIAKKVGYTDPNYFSYVFKRKFGVSPSKYRTEHTQSEK